MLTENNQIFGNCFVIIYCHLTKVSSEINKCIISSFNELSITLSTLWYYPITIFIIGLLIIFDIFFNNLSRMNSKLSSLRTNESSFHINQKPSCDWYYWTTCIIDALAKSGILWITHNIRASTFNFIVRFQFHTIWFYL